MQWRRMTLGLGMAALVGAMVTTYTIWRDGDKFSETVKSYRPAAASVEQPGYVDPKRFYWKTAEQLRRYVRQQREAIFKEVERAKTP